jgi:hypothetical protein
VLLYTTYGYQLMIHPLGTALSKYKHIILIAVTLVALGAYFLPLSTVFAGHNSKTAAGANQAARDAISKGHSSSPNSNSKTNSGTSSNPGSSSSGSSTGNSKTKGKDTTFSNGNSAQLGGPGDKGNIGRGNKGSGNIGNDNPGNGNIGNHNGGNGNCGNNNNGNGNVGNNGNGIGGGKYGGPRGCGHGQGP